MFTIEHIQHKKHSLNYIEIKDASHKTSAKIYLDQGGSLQELTLNTKTIIKNLSPLSYNTSFASAILFPFTCRIKDGCYTYKEKQYKLDPNFKEENSALHGLVYNKTFTCLSQEVSKEAATLTITYSETNKTKGFPYLYTIFLTYKLTRDALNLTITVKNKDQNSFPFTLGWHPYFWSNNLHDSYITLDSAKKLVFDKSMIPVKVEDRTTPSPLQIKDQSFDDCFILNNTATSFKTPDYGIDMNSSAQENYFQVYTPNNGHAIALEYLTGPANSFNNKLGLNELKPNESYSVNWGITLKNDE